MGKRRTVVVLKEGIGYADESSLLEWDAIVVGEDAVRSRGGWTCGWRGVSGCAWSGRRRTGKDVADVWDGLCISEEDVVEDAGGSGEGGEVDGGREGGACLRHRRVAEKDKTQVGVFFCYYFYFPPIWKYHPYLILT